LDRQKIGYTRRDNAFTEIADGGAAQALADAWDPRFWHSKLDAFANRYCPILKPIEESYHWSLDEAEYATDIVFQQQADRQAIYGHWIRTAIHTVKLGDIATFLGKKLSGNYHSSGALREALSAANGRYLEFLSASDDPSNGIHSTRSPEPCISRHDPIGDPTSSTETTKLFS
jgi:hypothetical protein